MKQEERRIYLIKELLREQPERSGIAIPTDETGQQLLLRSLFNVRMPHEIDEGFLRVQDAYLQEELRKKCITDIDELSPVREDIYLWQGDITTLRCDAIVNAANSQMLGCFYPCHTCIDNCIHTFASVQLRCECARLMRSQGHEEGAGLAKITPAYNLPCKYVLHTVGPIIRGRVTQEDEDKLAACYCSCLDLADKNGLQSIAFCCISTGEFHFPNDRAARIAVETVEEYRKQTRSKIKVIFNVFKDTDHMLYSRLLGNGV